MKISFSLKSDPRDRHIVLSVPNTKSWETKKLVSDHVFQGRNIRPVTEQSGEWTNFRFSTKYLDRLLLTFPFAELSHGIHQSLKRAEEVRLSDMRIPKIRIPGFRGKLYDYQKVAVGAIVWDKYAQEIGYKGHIDILNDEVGLGKGLANGTKVLTPSGWKQIQRLKVGDKVIGKNGKSTKIIGLFPQPKQELFKITFSDNSWVHTDSSHLWSVKDTNGREFILSTEQMLKGGTVKSVRPMPKGGTREYSIETFYKTKDGSRKWQIPMVEPVRFKRQDLPLDPYVLGVILGDGNISKTGLVTIEKGLDTPALRTCVSSKITTQSTAVGFSIKSKFLVEFGLGNHRSWEKFIPKPYLRGAPKQRLALLQGLMDTDGYAMPDGGAEFCSTSPNLTNGVIELVRSLGGIAHGIRIAASTYTYKGEKRQGRKAWRVNVKLPAPHNLFRLPRKAAEYRIPTKYQPARLIESIEPDGFGKSTCIKVDASDSLYVTKDYIVTHNTFIALAAIARLQAFPAICIVPNNSKWTSWKDALDEHFPDISYEIYDAQTQTKSERSAVLERRADITLVNHEAIRARPIYEHDNPHREVIAWDYINPELFEEEYAFGVLDEHHLVKSPGAQVTNGFFKLKAKRWLPMSGTPILNRPEEIWSILYKLYPDEIPPYGEFIKRLCVMNGMKVVAYKPDAMGELREFLQGKSIRRRKDQVLKDLPQTVTQTKLVTLTPEGRRIYEQIEDEMILETQDGTIKNIGGAFGHIVRMKQACFSPELFDGAPESAKIEELKDIVRSLVASGEKAIIFSQWETACRIIQRELAEYNPAYVTGKIKLKNRAEEIRKFNNDDDCHLYIGTIGANRESINLGAATYVIFTDEGWTPAGQDQAIGRSAAGGLRGVALPKGTKVTVIVLQAEDTYEQYIESLLNKKRSLFNLTTERDGGKIRKVIKVTLQDIIGSLSRRSQKKAKKSA